MYEVTQADIVLDREQVLSIWRGNLGSEARMAAKYDWFHQHGVDGAASIYLLRHGPGDHGVGALAVGPRRMQWHGQPLEAGLMADFAVAAGHRSLGPALILLREAAALQRAGLLYAFPNERAAPVYARAGYRQVGRAIRHARVLRHGDYLARHLPRALALSLGALVDAFDRLFLRPRTATSATWSGAAVDEMDQLWERSQTGNGLLTVRDAAYLRWRFDRCPLLDTCYLLLRDAGARLQAWFACHRRPDGVLVVADFWSQDACSGIARAHIHALLRAAREAGCTAVWFEFAGCDAAVASWRAAGFRERSSRPVFAFARGIPLDEVAACLHFTAADEDE